MEKPERLYFATSATFPGYWGSHKDSTHHAIVECIRAGADTGCVFVAYEGYEGCYFDEMGRSVYLSDHGNPFEKPEGVYDAAGIWLGENLAEVAKECQTDRYGDWVAEHPILSKETIASLKKHKPE